MSISQLLRGPVQFPGEAAGAQASPPAICERSRCTQLEAHRQEEISQGLQPGRRVHRLWFKDTGIEELLQALQSCSVHGEAHSGGQPAPTVTSFSHSAFWQARGLSCEAGGSHGEGVGLKLLEWWWCKSAEPQHTPGILGQERVTLFFSLHSNG